MAKQKVRTVLLKYHKIVPFPWTLPKIAKAGFIPKEFFLQLGEELSQCEDIGTSRAKKTLDAINKLHQETPE